MDAEEAEGDLAGNGPFPATPYERTRTPNPAERQLHLPKARHQPSGPASGEEHVSREGRADTRIRVGAGIAAGDAIAGWGP